MSFKNDIKNYQSMQNTSFYYSDVPASLWSELPTFIAKSCDEETFSTVIQKISELTLITASQSWSPEYSEEYIYQIKKKYSGNIDIVYDMLGILVKYGNAQDNDINELLKRNNIGYRCEYVIGDVTWYQEEENVVINKIEDLQYKVKTISQQTFEELEQAKKLLDNVNNERAIKDAVRSALSAIESLIKNIVKDEKINDDYDKAMTKLVAKGIGRKEILYNDNLWKTLHKLYPDLRHGSKNEVISKMPIEEAKYWIGKITNLSEYIISIAQL